MKGGFLNILIVISTICYSQVNDSIKNILAGKKNDLQKIQKLNALCETYWLTGNYKDANVIVTKLFSLEDNELKASPANQDILKEQANTYNNLAIIYRFQGNYSASLDNHLKALNIREAINDVRGIARSNLGLGTIYEFMGKYETALSYKLKAKKLFEQAKDTAFVAYTCNHIAGIYFEMGNIKEAEKYNSVALILFINQSNSTGMSDEFTLAGTIFESQKKYTDAISNYKGSLQSSNIFGLKDRTISSNIDLGRIYIKMNKLGLANNYLNNALSLSKQTGSKLHMSEIHELFYKRDSALQDFRSAFINYQLYGRYKDSLINQRSTEEIAKLQLNFENEKIEQFKKLEEEKKEGERKQKQKQQKIVLYSVSAVLLLMLVFSVFIFRSYRQKQKVNNDLLVKNDIIEKQKHLVEKKQTEILDSINYAKRIQYSLLASDKLLKDNLPKHFLFFKPKDVVSGDFYWGSHIVTSSGVGNFILATADSTGHGVPGAIMSMLNISCLNEAINADKLTQPADILNATRKKIIDHLSNDGSAEGGKDGMDCSLVCFDFAGRKLIYSAANNPVWVIRNKTFINLPSDRMPIGKHDKDSIPFTQNEVELEKGDMVYTLTDGFPDQFGGPKGKKFKYKQLEELLVSISHEPLEYQKQKLTTVFENWKGDLEQVDDVCIIGVRI